MRVQQDWRNSGNHIRGPRFPTFFLYSWPLGTVFGLTWVGSSSANKRWSFLLWLFELKDFRSLKGEVPNISQGKRKANMHFSLSDPIWPPKFIKLRVLSWYCDELWVLAQFWSVFQVMIRLEIAQMFAKKNFALFSCRLNKQLQILRTLSSHIFL